MRGWFGNVVGSTDVVLVSVLWDGDGRIDLPEVTVVFGFGRPSMVEPERAVVGRAEAVSVPERHEVLDAPLRGPWPAGLETVVLGMGCFWGAERIFWQAEGVYSTAVGYAGGYTPNPSYEEVCTGRTGHTEAVLVVFDPAKVSFERVLSLFFENHDPTQGFRQGNDIGTQYRSGIYTTSPEQERIARATKEAFQPVVTRAGGGDITTEIQPLTDFYYAETYHQQYLDKVPGGYCNHGPNGLSCPVGLGIEE